MFTKKTLALSLLQGFVVLTFDPFGEAEVRTLTITTIVIANLSLILTNRSWSAIIFETLRIPNRALNWVFAGTLSCLSFVLYIPALRNLFRFAPVPFIDLAACTGAGVLSIAWFEIYKYWSRGKGNGD